MAVKNQLAILWRGFTGKAPPRSVGDVVAAAGGTGAAARLAGVAQRTVQKWRREEQRATGSVRGMVTTLGGTAQAAAAAGVSERTVRRWQQQEREGRAPGPRQQARISRLQQAAVSAHTQKAQQNPRVQRMQQGVLGDAQARQRAIGNRRAARITQSGARFQSYAHTSVISTDHLVDDRLRTMDLELEGGILNDPLHEWMGGGDEGAVLDKLGQAITQHYLQTDENARAANFRGDADFRPGGRGAQFQFNDVRGLEISQRTPGAQAWQYRE